MWRLALAGLGLVLVMFAGFVGYRTVTYTARAAAR